MVILDEASSEDTYKNCEHLQNFITSAKIRYERKGMDTVMIKNCSRAIFLTNNDIATKIEQNDRRYQAMEVSSDMANNRSCFDKLLNVFEDKSQVKLLYLFFKHRDISKVNMQAARVETRLYSEMQSVNISSDLKFFYDQVDELNGNAYNCTAKTLHVTYSEWCMLRRKIPMAENSFAKRLNCVQYETFITKKRETSYTYYHLNVIELGSLKLKNSIDYTKVETFDKFPQKYMNEPEPEEENPPKKRTNPKKKIPQKK